MIVLPARVDAFGDSHLPRIDIQPLDASESSIVIKSLDIILILEMFGYIISKLLIKIL